MDDDAPYTYSLRNIDAKLWHQVKVYAAEQQMTIRQLMLQMLQAKVNNTADRRKG